MGFFFNIVTVPLTDNMDQGVLKHSKERLSPSEIPDVNIDTYVDILKRINSSDVLLEAWVKHVSVERDDPKPVSLCYHF